MQASEGNIPLDNGFNKSPLEFEEELKGGLVKIGIEHATVAISSKSKNTVFKYIEGLSSRLSISKRINEKFDNYLAFASKNTKGQLCYSQDKIIENRIFDHENLLIIQNNLNVYAMYEDLSYNYEITVIFHNIDTLETEALRQLELICEIIIAWANSWVAHHTMLLHWYRYSEQSSDSLPPILTKSEMGVLELLIKGLTGSEVAQIRHVSKETVRTQIKSILHKTQCRNQNQLISRFGQGQWLMNQPTRSIYT